MDSNDIGTYKKPVKVRDLQKVNTSELINKISKKNKIPYTTVQNIINGFADEITKNLKLGYAVNINKIVTLYPSTVFYDKPMIKIKANISKELVQECRDVEPRLIISKKIKLREFDTD